MPRWTGTVLDRFVEKVNFDGPDGCWLFTGAHDRDGYGSAWNGARLDGAHRLAWFFAVDAIPPGLTIDHLCRVKACVNPDHLEVVTQRTNTLRGTSAAARNAVKTHCPQGHLYTADNLYFTKSGGRRCKTCTAIRGKRRRDRRKELGLTCGLEDCSRPLSAKGLCQRHYDRQRFDPNVTCTHPECSGTPLARGLCSVHYRRQLKAR